MSKIIRMTPEMIEKAKQRFEEKMKTMNCIDGKISYTDAFTPTGEKAIVWFTPDAYAKMIALIQDSDDEVAWHGVAHRVDDAVGQYVITDILVYPQMVDGTNVNTDQAEYEIWLMEQDDDVFNNLRMQGHSHVRMNTGPSGTDLEHQAKIVQQLEGDMFYIFMIWNKFFKYTAKIYDLKINTLFEPGDISVQMVGSSQGLADFIKEARSMVKPKPYNNTYKYGGGYQGTYQNNSQAPKTQAAVQTAPTTTAPATTTSANKTVTAKEEKSAGAGSTVPTRPKPCIGNGWGGAANYQNNYPDYDDDYDPHSGYPYNHYN